MSASATGHAKDVVWLNIWSKILRQLIAVIREIEKDRDVIAWKLADDPQAVSRLTAFADGSQWWRYYELNEVAHAGLALLSFGVLPSTLRLILKGFGRGDLLGTLKENVSHLEPQPKGETHAFGATMSLGNSLRSRLICGEPLHALVRRADTDLDTFKRALRIDPLTLYCKPLQRRFSRAVAVQDFDTVRVVAECLRNPKKLASSQYPELQYSLALLHAAHQLPRLSELRAEQLFLVRLADLHVYKGDPRHLARLIQRFRKKVATQNR